MIKQQIDRIDELIKARIKELYATWVKDHPRPEAVPATISELLATGLHCPGFTKELVKKLAKDHGFLNQWRAHKALVPLVARHCPEYRTSKAANDKWEKARASAAAKWEAKVQKLKDRILFDGIDLERILAEIRAIA